MHCSFCYAPDSTHKCGKCSSAFYCNSNCQKLHWNSVHSLICAESDKTDKESDPILLALKKMDKFPKTSFQANDSHNPVILQLRERLTKVAHQRNVLTDLRTSLLQKAGYNEVFIKELNSLWAQSEQKGLQFAQDFQNQSKIREIQDIFDKIGFMIGDKGEVCTEEDFFEESMAGLVNCWPLSPKEKYNRTIARYFEAAEKYGTFFLKLKRKPISSFIGAKDDDEDSEWLPPKEKEEADEDDNLEPDEPEIATEIYHNELTEDVALGYGNPEDYTNVSAYLRGLEETLQDYNTSNGPKLVGIFARLTNTAYKRALIGGVLGLAAAVGTFFMGYLGAKQLRLSYFNNEMLVKQAVEKGTAKLQENEDIAKAMAKMVEELGKNVTSLRNNIPADIPQSELGKMYWHFVASLPIGDIDIEARRKAAVECLNYAVGALKDVDNGSKVMANYIKTFTDNLGIVQTTVDPEEIRGALGGIGALIAPKGFWNLSQEEQKQIANTMRTYGQSMQNLFTMFDTQEREISGMVAEFLKNNKEGMESLQKTAEIYNGKLETYARRNMDPGKLILEFALDQTPVNDSLKPFFKATLDHLADPMLKALRQMQNFLDSTEGALLMSSVGFKSAAAAMVNYPNYWVLTGVYLLWNHHNLKLIFRIFQSIGQYGEDYQVRANLDRIRKKLYEFPEVNIIDKPSGTQWEKLRDLVAKVNAENPENYGDAWIEFVTSTNYRMVTAHTAAMYRFTFESLTNHGMWVWFGMLGVGLLLDYHKLALSAAGFTAKIVEWSYWAISNSLPLVLSGVSRFETFWDLTKNSVGPLTALSIAAGITSRFWMPPVMYIRNRIVGKLMTTRGIATTKPTRLQRTVRTFNRFILYIYSYLFLIFGYGATLYSRRNV